MPQHPCSNIHATTPCTSAMRYKASSQGLQLQGLQLHAPLALFMSTRPPVLITCTVGTPRGNDIKGTRGSGYWTGLKGDQKITAYMTGCFVLNDEKKRKEKFCIQIKNI